MSERDDTDDTEQDAQDVEDNPELAWLWTVLWITPGRSVVDGGWLADTLLHPPVVGEAPEETLDVP